MKTFTIGMRKERAELLLGTRTQQPNEGVVIFAEEMKRLFRHAVPEITKEKVSCLLRGLKLELLPGHMSNLPDTVAELVSEARRM